MRWPVSAFYILQVCVWVYFEAVSKDHIAILLLSDWLECPFCWRMNFLFLLLLLLLWSWAFHSKLAVTNMELPKYKRHQILSNLKQRVWMSHFKEKGIPKQNNNNNKRNCCWKGTLGQNCMISLFATGVCFLYDS